ncbi:hypothetical protein FKG94_19870 [Exilibacterium tricleocarpae]|uniref:Peptidase M61 catalytic domain-containing protein n=1 Tax=Exilibacterium tricleocarpae TaxID=2591008 RepID=A0A545T1Q0_9GAMM|nr:hypothetical protein [Exilibacterium tricleocarpae]TQV71147.1 hypothetical protein FKG94_19870 [Exilibacterium tricleocarpae]
MTKPVCCCWVFLLLGSLPAWGHRYDIAIDPRLSLLQVRLCFDGAAPTSLTSGDRRAGTYLSDVYIDSPEPAGRVSVRRGRMRLQDIAADACIAYKVSLQQIAQGRRSSHIGDSRLLDIRSWLWRPETVPASTQLHFSMPAGVEVATPWPPLPGRRHGFLLPDTPADWSGRVAFGRVRKTSVNVAGAELHISLVGPFDDRQIDEVRTWVRKTAENISGVYGRFPVVNAGVLVMALGDRYGSGPVPWAEVQRSGRPEAHFFINQNLPLAAFLADWTPTHELAHMLHPAIAWQFKWFYEGLASYYQNVARARGGQLSQRQAWQKLYDGFERGLKQSRQPDRRGSPKYMEMYWRGAAAALLADVRLRKESHNRHSLDSALSQFQQCCFAPVKTWDGFAFFRRLDELTDSRVFSSIFGKYARSDEFPDVLPVLRDLGIQVKRGRVHLTDESDWLALRTDLMTKPVVVGVQQSGGLSLPAAGGR